MAAYILFKMVIGFVAGIAVILVAIVAVIAVIWALRSIDPSLRAVEFVVIALVFGIATAAIGRLKGGSIFIWFLVGVALPGIGILAALLSARPAARAAPQLRSAALSSR